MNKFMLEAILEAKKGYKSNQGGPFGSIIVKNGKIISRGHNRVVATNDPTCHSEIDALRKAGKKLNTFDLSGCELYATGFPCPMCFGAILWANIDKVYYGCTTADAEKIGFRDKIFEKKLQSKKKSICKELDRNECLKIFEDYNNIKDKTNY